MPDDRNSKLAALLAEAAEPDEYDPHAPRGKQGESPPARPLCPDCGDVAGDGIACPACRAIRAAKHQRTPDEQAMYDKAKQTRPIDATPVRDWRRKLPPGDIPEGNDGEPLPVRQPCAGSIESMRPPIQAGEGGVNPTPALHDTKGIDMAARLPRGEMPPLQTAEPPRHGANPCANPRSNPRCLGTSTKRLCRSCGILESRIRRGLADGDAVLPAAETPASPPPPRALAPSLRSPPPVQADAGTPGPLTAAVADFMAAAFRAAGRVEAKMTADRAAGKLSIQVDLYGQAAAESAATPTS